MMFSLVPMPYRILALAAFAAALMAFGYVRGLHAGEAKLDAYVVAQQAATIKEQVAAATKTRAMQAQKDEALRVATARAQRNAADAADARGAAVSLRDELADTKRKLSSASLDAVRQYAATLSDVFEQCVSRYTGVAEKAGGHASDTLMLEQAWPR